MDDVRLRERSRSGQGPNAGQVSLRPPVRTSRHGLRRSVADLERMVEIEVVPRLLLASGRETAPPRCDAGPSLEALAEAAVALARVVLKGSDAAAVAYVDEIRSKGLPIERIYLNVISPAARHLGDLWLADLCGFTDVTVGLWRLQHVLRNMSPLFQQGAAHNRLAHQALLVPLPREQHTFGLYMVAEFFRRAGWNVLSMPLQTADELFAAVRGEWFAVIGLSMSCENRLDELAWSIRTIRRTSRNPGIGVMVGGNVFIERPELVAMVGADIMAIDGRQAPAKAQELIMSLAPNQ
jgi:MerR family transcriptional regulator, light-induced transcriptional regulator